MRRKVLKTGLMLAGAAAAAGLPGTGAGAQTPARSKTLVAYFSRTANTRLVAKQIARARNAALFEIEPAVPYPEDYEETVRGRERDEARV